MGTALNRGRSLAWAVMRASVNKGAGWGAQRTSPREEVGPRGSGAHACGQPFSLPPGGGAAGGRVRICGGGRLRGSEDSVEEEAGPELGGAFLH